MQEPLLYHEVHGTRGPFILLVHGMISSRAQWIPNLEALTAFGRPVIVELFGHGRSPSPEDPECYTPDNYVNEFEGIRNKLGVDRWFLCGQSLGASLTLRYALYHPERVVAQIFTNSQSALSDQTWDDALNLFSQRLKEEGHKLIQTLPLHPTHSRHINPEIKNVLVEDAKLIDVGGFSYTLLNTVAKCSVRTIINRNQIPTLLIVGKHDKPFLPYYEFVQQNMPELEALVLDGGHAVNIDASEQFNKATQDFIERFINAS